MGFSSTLSFATRTRPATSTGTGERSTSAENVASVTVTGRVSIDTGRGVLQRPHTGSRPLSTLSRGTRLATPQAGQRMTSVSDMAVAPPGKATRLHDPLAKELLRVRENAPGLRLRPAHGRRELRAGEPFDVAQPQSVAPRPRHACHRCVHARL